MAKLFLPRSGSPWREGLRLLAGNLSYIAASICLAAAVFLAGTSLPVSLIAGMTFSALLLIALAVSGAGYVYLWARFSTEYVSRLREKKVRNLLMVNGIGIVPNLVFLFLVRYLSQMADPNACGTIVWVLAYLVFGLSAICMPLLALLAFALSALHAYGQPRSR